MIKHKNTMILIDESLENDHRVLNVIDACLTKSDIIDCSKSNSNSITLKKLFIINIFFLIKCIFLIPFYWLKLYQSYRLKPSAILAGLKYSLKAKYMAKKMYKKLKNEYRGNTIKAVYANDLNCGLLGINISRYFKVPLIYDAHEVEFHRNRKNSLFRVVCDLLFEQKVINVAKKVIVVNRPIKMLYMDIYNIPESKITIINNNFFAPHMGRANIMSYENINEIAIVYVGEGIKGRKLESLGLDCSQTNAKVHGFFLSRTPDIAYEYNWILGSTDYLLELLELIKKKRSIMWCCTDDTCLSYRLSLPNKFFQAMAVGIPVIAYKGTYLAEIVRENNLGFTYDDHNFREITDQLKDSKKYYALLESVSVFQEKLFLEKLEL